MRIFIAVPLPEAVKNTLAKLQVPSESIQWQPRFQLHITLKFLGEVSDSNLQLLKQELAGISQPPFLLHLKQWGTFPEKGRPKVIWVGVEPEEKITALHIKVEHCCTALGFDAEVRPFVPHITLGRPKGTLRKELTAMMRNPEPLEFSVRSFGIYNSKLGPEGAQHSLVKKYPLDT